MTTLFTLFGFCGAFLLFLYLLRIKDAMKRLIKNTVPRDSNERKFKERGLQFAAREIKRRCPLCRMPLADDEYLVCAMGPDLGQTQKRQAHIYGCKNCFSGA